MPSVITTGLHSNKSYAPLADEVNPPFGNVAPSPTSVNGSIVYSKRISSPTVTLDDHGPNASSSRVLREDSDDTLSGSDHHRKGKGRGHWSSTSTEEGDESGDIGAVRSSYRLSKSKGKERAWDSDGYTRQVEPETSSYPPLNDVEEEEKRVQANLAKFTARETARRKAARQSRVVQSPVGSESPNSSSASLPRTSGSRTSHGSRPMSFISESISSAKRSNGMGWGSLTGKDKRVPEDIELPASPTVTTGSAGPNAYTNPYDPQPPPAAAAKPTSPTSPTMQRHGPFADPHSHSRRMTASSPLTSPIDEGGFGYAGPGWRGGAAVAGTSSSTDSESTPPPSKPERWWHALCSWGSDLDGGHGNKASNQAGRTNPFE
ncbi:uncharacterized protein EHS24_000585 [Apiotrichum porosum]|uniref:Uncharacterized protein n=1 Tax=Apiotrichum porosum TaxID=105984 RepID=A0A427YAE7_9TREE|nr:uncharacterized protein EHS24_000585 [Apiotrichum porosum]RSH88058.1 hypothetical protein EHS24_000585 [Apiotrichum porosum]